MQLIVAGMQELKAEDIVVLNLKDIKNSIADYFVVCSGTSDTHINSIAHSIEKQVKDGANERPHAKEGATVREWILLDYVNVVAHVFEKDKREYYDLEGLWSDAETIRFDDLN